MIEETTSTDSVDGVMTPDVAKPVALLPPQSSSSVLLLQSRVQSILLIFEFNLLILSLGSHLLFKNDYKTRILSTSKK